MPETTTSGAAAADAAKAPASPDGATPPAAGSPASNQTMSAAEADRVLNGLTEPASQRDPLDTDSVVDPLFNEGEVGNDLGELPETEATDETADEPEQVEIPEESAEQPEASDETAEETPAETSRKRLNINRRDANGNYIHSDFERAQMALAAEEGISLSEAAQRLGGRPEAQKPAAEAAKADVKPERTVADVDREIAAKRTELKDAKRSFNQDAEDKAEDAIEALRQERENLRITDLKRELEQRKQQEQSATVFEQKVDESIKRASARYPDAIKTGSALHAAIAAETTRLDALKSPIFQDEDWPEMIAAKVANKIGIAPTIVAKSEAKPAAKAAATPAKRATPVPAPGAMAGKAPAVDPYADISRRLDEATAKQDTKAIDALMKEITALDSKGRRAA